MELTIGKEKIELVEAAKQSFQAQRARTIRALAVLVAAGSGALEAVELQSNGKSGSGSYLLVDPEKNTVLALSELKGNPRPKGMIRGAVVNQRVEQDWADKQVPAAVVALLDDAFKQALGALGNGKPQKAGKKAPAPKKAAQGKKPAGLAPGKAAPKPAKKGVSRAGKKGFKKDAPGPRPGRGK